MFFVAGCAKDRNAEEYQREKADATMAQYNRAGGQYSGVAYSQENGEVLGAMQLSLRAERLVTPPREGNSAIGSPNLVGSLKFLDEAITTLNVPVSFYDPSTGTYQAEIRISRGGSAGGNNGGGDGENGGDQLRAAQETVVLSGTISADSITGFFHSSANPELGGRFVLRKNGESMQTLLERARPGWRPDPNGRNKVRSFVGETEFTLANTTRPAHVIMLQPRTGTETDFLDLISPVKTVELSFNYSQSLHIVFEKALFDRRQGLITGSTVLTVNNQKLMRMTIECRVGEHLRCNHLNASGVTARTSARLNTGDVQYPPESPEGRESITKTFVGSGIFGDKLTRITLKVTKPAKSSLEAFLELFFPNSESPMDATLIVGNVDVTFSTGVWNALTGLMEASYVAADHTRRVKCNSFYFKDSRLPFRCEYSNTRMPGVTIDFKPPYQ